MMRGGGRPNRKNRDNISMSSMSSYDDRNFGRQPSGSYGKPVTSGRRDRTRSRSRDRRHSRERESRYSRESYEDRRHEHKVHSRSKDEHEENYLDAYREEHENRSEEPTLDPSTFHLPFRSLEEERKEEAKNEDRINRLEKLVEVLVSSTVQKKPNETQESNDLREVPELIPRNNKFTTSMWLNRIHEYCLEKNFDERTSIKYLQNQMTGIVKAWFKTVQNFDFTWPELKMLITKTFPDNVEFAHSLRLLINREKHADETITDYYFTKLYLCEACKISGENAVSCLIDGLTNPFMKQDIKAYNFLTPEALFSQYLAKFPDEQRRPHEDHPPRDVEFYEEDEPMLHPQEDKIKYRGKKKVIKCETCNKFGHRTIDCRHAPMCYNCNKRGHIAAKCRNVKKVKLLSPNSSLNTIVCEINNTKIKGFVDSGSGVVTLKESIANKMGIKWGGSRKILEGFAGGIAESIGETILKIKVGEFEAKVPVTIVEDDLQTEDLIIGQPIINHDEAAVVIRKGEVRIFKEKSFGEEK